MRNRFLLVGVSLLCAFLVVACAGGSEGGGVLTATESAGPAATATVDGSDASVANVRLFEWSVDPGADSVAAGPVTFNVRNAGLEPHDLIIIRTDLASGALPTKEDGSVDELGAGIEVIGRTEQIEAGREDAVTFNLEPGAYVLICNIVQVDVGIGSHYLLGMRISLEVTE